jgi:hypothetical protein
LKKLDNTVRIDGIFADLLTKPRKWVTMKQPVKNAPFASLPCVGIAFSSEIQSKRGHNVSGYDEKAGTDLPSVPY